MPSRYGAFWTLKVNFLKLSTQLQKSTFTLFVISCFCLIGPEISAAVSSEEVAQPLSLKEAWLIAKDGNSEFRSAKLTFELAKISYERRRFSLLYPKLDFSSEIRQG